MSLPAITASVAFREVANSVSVESIRNADHALISTMSPGDVVRQGDLYLVALRGPIAGGKPAGSNQLAPGHSQGSRHVAVGDCDVLTVDEAKAVAAINRLVPATKDQRLFVGPMIRARGAVTIAHPEHGDRTLPPGSYLVTYQRAWSREIRRALD